jgi:hypothetical protein
LEFLSFEFFNNLIEIKKRALVKKATPVSHKMHKASPKPAKIAHAPKVAVTKMTVATMKPEKHAKAVPMTVVKSRSSSSSSLSKSGGSQIALSASGSKVASNVILSNSREVPSRFDPLLPALHIAKKVSPPKPAVVEARLYQKLDAPRLQTPSPFPANYLPMQKAPSPPKLSASGSKKPDLLWRSVDDEYHPTANANNALGAGPVTRSASTRKRKATSLDG